MGGTYFVELELAVGTLREGFERISALGQPLAQAIMMMFVVAEQLRQSFAQCNAFEEDLRNYKLLFPPAKPVDKHLRRSLLNQG